MWSGILKKGNALRITDLEGGANVPTLLFNKDHVLERYNMADTLKGQHTFKLTQGNVLYSDMGRAMCSIIKDTCGWHDTVSGVSTAESVNLQFGSGTYQDLKNDFYRNGRDNFLIEMGKWGLGKQDLLSNLNFFTRISIGAEGEMTYCENNSQAGDFIDLRAEIDLLVVLNTCIHPMNPTDKYEPKPVELTIWKCDPVSAGDECLNSRPENQRAFENSRIYCACSGH